MPLFDYECRDCGEVEEWFFPIKEKPKTVDCRMCGGRAVAIMTVGAIQGDELPSYAKEREAVGCYLKAGERMPETRSEYKRHLAARGIEEVPRSRFI